MSVKAVCVNGRWSVRVNWRRHRTTRQVHPNTETRALEVAEKLKIALQLYGVDALAILDDRKPPEPRIVPTVKQYAEKWIGELDKTDLKRSTRDSYRRLICNYVVPAFGAMQIDKITYPALKAWVIEQTNRYSKDTVRLMLAAFRAMLTEAIHDGHISVNPVEHLGRFYRSGHKRKAAVDPFTLEELHAIEEVCARRFPEYYGFVLLMSRTGMRIGEATGFEWQDIFRPIPGAKCK